MSTPNTPQTRNPANKPAQPAVGKPADPAEARPWSDEPDIGSGEKTAAEHETEALIRQIPMLPPQRPEAPPPAHPAKPKPS